MLSLPNGIKLNHWITSKNITADLVDKNQLN